MKTDGGGSSSYIICVHAKYLFSLYTMLSIRVFPWLRVLAVAKTPTHNFAYGPMSDAIWHVFAVKTSSPHHIIMDLSSWKRDIK